MGPACGCTHEPPECEVTTIDLAKIPFNETSNQHLAIPIVDLEQEFTNIINEIKLDNSLVNVYLISIIRKDVLNKVLLDFLINQIFPYSIWLRIVSQMANPTLASCTYSFHI